MKEKARIVYETALKEINEAQNQKTLEDIKNKYLSRKSELNGMKKYLKDLPDDEKRSFGSFLNNITTELSQKTEEKMQMFLENERNEKLKSESLDITLPGNSLPFGKLHPLTVATEEIVSVFRRMGYSVVKPENSPETETEYINFDMLNFPPFHPARDMQDTFFTQNAPNVILRSQTSTSQIRTMLSQKPPIRVISPGRVYRCESMSARKSNMFHQVEGLLIDEGVTLADLKGTLEEFVRLYFGSSRPTRLRSSFFPFTEPSVEVDVQCILCNGKGCSVCSGTGWLEILGAGMVHVNVLKNCGIDPEKYSGFAFGTGVERMTMLKYAIDDIRLFFNNDMRFLSQFSGVQK